MNKTLRALVFGFLSWLIPFAASFLFYSKEGLTIDIFLFKSIMIVVGSISGAFLLVLYIKKLNKDIFREAAIVGLLWFGMNIMLDSIILLPMSKMAFGTYFMQIGLRYLVIPVMSISMGTVARR
tara:strand:- start:7923 stop:8294 length:372 start_codon:yes stop_codon:yes gene_type:complete